MAFERIKTVRGKKYKYLVENVWENGKTKQKIIKYFGRADKQPELPTTSGAIIPDGIYYFAQDSCSGCDSEEHVRKMIECFHHKAGIKIPKIFYINTKEANPTNITIERTPTVVVSDNGKLFVGRSLGDYGYYYHMLGRKQFEEIEEQLYEEDNGARMIKIKEHIRNGKKFRELCSMGYSPGDIRICQGEPAKKAKGGCEDGTCPVP